MLAKLRSLVGTFGYLNAAIYAFDRLGEHLGGNIEACRMHIVAQRIPPGPWLRPGRGDSFHVELLGPERLAELPDTVSRTRALHRWSSGIECLAIFKDRRCVGYIWVAHDHYDEELTCVRFAPVPAGTGAFLLDLFILPEYRASLVLPRLWDETFRFLRERGRLWIAEAVSVLNVSSVNFHRSMKATFLGHVIFLRVGPLQVMISNLSPRCRITLQKKEHITLPLWCPACPAGKGSL
jgi:hypothetical protein